MRESTIERKLRLKVEAQGGMAIKLAGTSVAGMPDRLILLPDATIFFVETKTPTGTLSPRQEYVINQIWELGFQTQVISSPEAVNRFMEKQNTGDLKKRGAGNV